MTLVVVASCFSRDTPVCGAHLHCASDTQGVVSCYKVHFKKPWGTKNFALNNLR